jgi:hypothetical protein
MWKQQPIKIFVFRSSPKKKSPEAVYRFFPKGFWGFGRYTR